MTDDPKKPSADDTAQTGQTVTKIERPRRAVEMADDAASDASKTAGMDLEAQAAAAKASAKKELDDAEAKKAAEPAKKADESKKREAKTVPMKRVAPKDADEDEEDEDDEGDDEDGEDDAPVRRPGKAAATSPFVDAKKKGAGGGGGKQPPRGGGGGGGAGEPRGDGRKARASGESAGLLLLTGAFLVFLNIGLKGCARARVDATREQRFTLSEKGTAHLLSTLKKPLHMKIFAPQGFATVDNFIRDLKDLLDEYVRLGAGKVDYEIIYPDALEGDQKAKAESDAQEAGLKKEIIGEAKGGGGGDKAATIGEGFLGMVMTYGGEKAKLDQGDGFDERNAMGLEFLISTKIRELRDKEDKISHRIGWLGGHKEQGFNEISGVFGKYLPFYKLEQVMLDKGEKPVDVGLDGLIISQPGEEIPSKELRRIDEFLMKGKAVAVFANKVHIKEADASMNATFAGMGIDKLLSGYGIDYKDGIVVDRQQVWAPVLQTRSGQLVQLPPYAVVMYSDSSRGETSFDNKFAPLFRLAQLPVAYPEEITIDKARAGGDAVKITPVIRTTPTIMTITGSSISLHPEKLGAGGDAPKQETRAKGQEAIVGVDLEGPIKSAFPGGGEGVDGVPANATGNARLFVVSSGYFFGNPFADAGKSPFGGMQGMPENFGADERLMLWGQAYRTAFIQSIMVAWHTCDWMSEETDLLAVGAKLLTEPELTYPRSPAPIPAPDEKPDSDTYKKKKQAWIDQIKSDQKYTNLACTLGGPIILVLYGVFRWYRRNAVRAAVKL